MYKLLGSITACQGCARAEEVQPCLITWLRLRLSDTRLRLLKAMFMAINLHPNDAVYDMYRWQSFQSQATVERGEAHTPMHSSPLHCFFSTPWCSLRSGEAIMKGSSTVKLNAECAVVRNSGNANPVTAEESVQALRCRRLAVQAVLGLRTRLHSDKLYRKVQKDALPRSSRWSSHRTFPEGTC